MSDAHDPVEGLVQTLLKELGEDAEGQIVRRTLAYAVRTESPDPASVMPAARRVIANVNPNLTVANVVGFEKVLAAIPRVWASPFTERAYAWRQAHMETPEHVYPSILMMQSIPNDKSGVMVTRDLDSGAPQILSVAVNEGIGGAVDGQSAESLRIDTRDGSIRLLAMATAPWRRNLVPDGGIEKVPVSGSDMILQPAEIRRLISFADELPRRFPSIVDEAGKPVPADVEFGFLDGKLQLFQIRPFLDSRLARGSQYLNRMDATLDATLSKTIDLREVPQ